MFKKIFGRDPEPAPAAKPARWTRLPGESDRAELERMAHHFLPPDDARRWLGLLRPSIHLTPGPAAGALARLGGRPRVPADFVWPEWPEHGPLAYLGELRCTELARFELDFVLPSSGRLLFFYWDGSVDEGVNIVEYQDPSTLAGMRLIQLDEDVDSTERVEPDGVTCYPEAHYVSQSRLTDPGWESPDFIEAFDVQGVDPRSRLSRPVYSREFADARYDRQPRVLHQIGGHAHSLQGGVEYEVAQTALLLGGASGRSPLPELTAEARRWRLLFQFDTDGRIGMDWGGGGSLYWLVRVDELARGELDRALFTWQC